MIKENRKPIKKTIRCYDYNECSKYLEKKYGYKERKWSNKTNDDQDFWYWVITKYTVARGSFVTFSRESLEEDNLTPDWVKAIYNYYLTEFADEDGKLLMLVDW